MPDLLPSGGGGLPCQIERKESHNECGDVKMWIKKERMVRGCCEHLSMDLPFFSSHFFLPTKNGKSSEMALEHVREKRKAICSRLLYSHLSVIAVTVP